MRRALLAAVVLGGIGVSGCVPLKQGAPCSMSPNLAVEVFDLVNQDRAANGVAPVAWDGGLSDLASWWSQRIATDVGFRHSTDAERFGYGATDAQRTQFAGAVENIQHARLDCVDAATVEAAWMASDGHRSNILRTDHERLGVGIARVGDGWMVTQEFGRATA